MSYLHQYSRWMIQVHSSQSPAHTVSTCAGRCLTCSPHAYDLRLLSTSNSMQNRCAKNMKIGQHLKSGNLSQELRLAAYSSILWQYHSFHLLGQNFPQRECPCLPPTTVLKHTLQTQGNKLYHNPYETLCKNNLGGHKLTWRAKTNLGWRKITWDGEK